MSQVLLARSTCPNCQNQIQAPVEQIIDVRKDPDAKMRVLNGLVNVAACPQCGMRGGLNLPFLYHDPDKELALVYMPMDTGRDNMEQQQFIGNLTSTVMNDLPPEERKAYLLQPQTFLTMENMSNTILEADGVTPEMIAEQKAKTELLQRMLDASSDEVLDAIIKANDDAIDGDLLGLLAMNLEAAQSSGQEANLQKLLVLRNKLLEMSSEGQEFKAREEMVEALRAEPTREKLVELLIQAPDEQTRQVLVAFGRPMLDYLFFQSLTSHIDSAEDKGERERLTALRTEILEIRDKLDEDARALYEKRGALLRDLLLSEDPETLARQRFRELDQVFFNVLGANMEEAQSSGESEAAKALEAIWGLIMKLIEETLPPEMQLFNRLFVAENDEQIEQLLQDNRDLVTVRLVEFMRDTQAKMRQDGEEENAERLGQVLEKVQEMV
ncbi:MAG: hypothetical protein GY832_04000 [Chloroflexi bacterium]|nr:hypothetical protein [Chloroflexota bacterium]